MGRENLQREIENELLNQENLFSENSNYDLRLKFNNKSYDLIVKKKK